MSAGLASTIWAYAGHCCISAPLCSKLVVESSPEWVLCEYMVHNLAPNGITSMEFLLVGYRLLLAGYQFNPTICRLTLVYEVLTATLCNDGQFLCEYMVHNAPLAMKAHPGMIKGLYHLISPIFTGSQSSSMLSSINLLYISTLTTVYLKSN